MPPVPVNDWASSFMTALADALTIMLATVPRLIGFLLVIGVGWFISSLLARAVGALLRSIHFNSMARRAGLTDFVESMGLQTSPSPLVVNIVRWTIRLLALVVAFDALGLPAVSAVLRDIILWIPNLIVALAMLVIAGLASGAVSRLVQGAATEAGLDNPPFLAALASAAIWGFGIVAAVNQVGIAETIVNTLFTALVAVLALSFAVAFGLGGQELAANLVRSWYQAGQAAMPQLAQAASVAGQPPEPVARVGRVSLQPTVIRALMQQIAAHGGIWSINKRDMPTHWHVLANLVQEGQLEQVQETATTITFQLPEQAHALGE